MPDQRVIDYLNQMRAKGELNNVAAVLDQPAPVLDELGIPVGGLRAALDGHFDVGLSLAQVEAGFRALRRPPLIVQDGHVPDKACLAGIFDADIKDQVTAIEPFLGAIGRVTFRNHARNWGGAGWVIAVDGPDYLVMTSRSVALQVAKRVAGGQGVFLFAPSGGRFGAAMDFSDGADDQVVCDMQRFAFIADDPAVDVAIARVRADDGAAFDQLPVAPTSGQDQERVALVGYPAIDDFVDDPTGPQAGFRVLRRVKRFSPGVLRISAGSDPTHDCTVLGGMIGAPLISLDCGAVIGLQGVRGIVPVETLKILLDETVPTTSIATIAELSEDQGHDAKRFAGRDGYDPQFLGQAEVPLPTVPTALDLARPPDATKDRPHELRYQHFGVLFSLAQKSPVIAALNIDGAQTRRIKRGNTRWRKDLRVPADMQLGRAAYADPDIDRGHMVRRAATNWGPDAETARRANADTFHYTVASPQHRGLNQNPRTWLGLEDYIMDNVRTFGFRANVFTGPVFSDDDPPLAGTDATIPLNYFKVVSMLAEDEEGTPQLHATAYVLSQGPLVQAMLQDMPSGGFVFGEFRTFQVRIRDLEQMSGYDFGPLRDADPLERPDTVLRLQPIEQFTQIQL